jgi:hypothetical protein
VHLGVALDYVQLVAVPARRGEHHFERYDALAWVGEDVALAAGRGLLGLVLDVEAGEPLRHAGQQLAPRTAAVVGATVRKLEVVVVVEEPQPVLARDRRRPVELPTLGRRRSRCPVASAARLA